MRPIACRDSFLWLSLSALICAMHADRSDRDSDSDGARVLFLLAE